MKTFFKILVALILLFVGVGLALDNKVNVSRQIEINATPEQIHVYVHDLHQWNKWSPWPDLDPTIKSEIKDISAGVGAAQSWTGESGAGHLKLTHSSVNDGIVYDLSFEGDPTLYQAGLKYSQQGNTTLVTWYMTGEMQPIVIGNYFAQLMDALVGDSFTNGLEKLKHTVENDAS